jgi:biopolymer transport protein TolQ
MSSPQIAQTGILGLITEAGPVAKFVLILLLATSIYSWTIIFMKGRSLKRALSQNKKFLDVFWHGKSIDEIFGQADQFPGSPVASIFKSGVKELKKLSASNDLQSAGQEGVQNIQRALARASNAEITGLESHISWLATTASASPFVGLFGTVWGIMSSFQSIGATGAANLAIVAPGISEALITTATGIAAAIPAVVAYNHFVGKIKRQAVDMENFTQDFLNIIQRSVFVGSARKAP